MGEFFQYRRLRQPGRGRGLFFYQIVFLLLGLGGDSIVMEFFSGGEDLCGLLESVGLLVEVGEVFPEFLA